MKVLFYDTETTGLPDWDKPSEDPCQPRVVQLCAELFDDEAGRVLHALNFIIQADGWTVPDEAAAVHGITTEIALSHGVPMRAVLPLFVSLWKQSDIRCAHNMLAAGRRHAKSPNLGEAYEFFTGRKLVNAHDAAVDVAACKAVYLALKERAA